MTRPRKISEGDCRGTAYYMFDCISHCIGDCRGTLQGGLQGDCRKTPRGLQEDVPVNPGGKGAAGTLGPASADLAQHARTSCRGNSEGTPGGLQGALQGVCRKILGGLQEDVPGNPGGKDTPGTCGPACEPGFKEGRGACSGLDCRGTAGGTAGGLLGACRKIGGGLQGDVPGNSGGKGTAGTLRPTAVYSDCPPRGYPKNRNMKTDKKHP